MNDETYFFQIFRVRFWRDQWEIRRHRWILSALVLKLWTDTLESSQFHYFWTSRLPCLQTTERLSYKQDPETLQSKCGSCVSKNWNTNFFPCVFPSSEHQGERQLQLNNWKSLRTKRKFQRRTRGRWSIIFIQISTPTDLINWRSIGLKCSTVSFSPRIRSVKPWIRRKETRFKKGWSPERGRGKEAMTV